MKTTENENDLKTNEDYTSDYFKIIKGNQAELRQFFTQMPKGGDIHNHLTGSAYAETYFELATKKGMYVDLETGNYIRINQKRSKSYNFPKKWTTYTITVWLLSTNGVSAISILTNILSARMNTFSVRSVYYRH